MISLNKLRNSIRRQTILYNFFGYVLFVISAPDFLPYLNGPVFTFVVSLILIYHGYHHAKEDLAKFRCVEIDN